MGTSWATSWKSQLPTPVTLPRCPIHTVVTRTAFFSWRWIKNGLQAALSAPLEETQLGASPLKLPAAEKVAIFCPFSLRVKTFPSLFSPNTLSGWQKYFAISPLGKNRRRRGKTFPPPMRQDRLGKNIFPTFLQGEDIHGVIWGDPPIVFLPASQHTWPGTPPTNPTAILPHQDKQALVIVE